eukprot:m.111498 g.111498  ORF g.111498 m.111498 type:complete len:167 (+) comp10753_c2_seq1:313-813(+)
MFQVTSRLAYASVRMAAQHRVQAMARAAATATHAVRSFTAGPVSRVPEAGAGAAEQPDKISVIFQNSDGDKVQCYGRVGDTLLDVAIDNDIDLEGACGGTLACSTCHVYIDEDYMDKFPERDIEEEDMLDLASAVKDNSRLGCQCQLDMVHSDIVVTLADEYTDAR